MLLSKNRFGKFWNFDPWRPQFWPEPKNDRNDFEMIFRELSNASFRFSLRRPGAEIMGGGRSNAPPPPSRRWKIQRPSRARVKLRKDFCFICLSWTVLQLLKWRHYFSALLVLTPFSPNSQISISQRALNLRVIKWGYWTERGTTRRTTPPRRGAGGGEAEVRGETGTERWTGSQFSLL